MSNQDQPLNDSLSPATVPSTDIADFERLSDAMVRDDARIIRARRRSNGEEVSLIVVESDVLEDNRVIPIAEVVGLRDEFEVDVLTC